MNEQSVIAGEAQRREPMRWLRPIILGLSGLFYAYAVWNAVAHMVTLGQLGLNTYGWFVLLFAVVFPMLVYSAAFVVGRRRGVGDLTMAMLAGLGLVAVFWMNVVAFSLLNFSSLSA